MQGSESVKKGKVISYAGSVIALLIGSGFATGQEITQYFVSYGYKGILGAGTCFVLLTYAVISFGTAGYREQFANINDIYRYCAGNKLGTFYDFFSVLFIFLSYTVMISGASATGVQHYHWHPLLGGIYSSNSNYYRRFIWPERYCRGYWAHWACYCCYFDRVRNSRYRYVSG